MPNPYRFKHNANIFKNQLKEGIDNIYDRLQLNQDLEFSSVIRNISLGLKDAILGLGKPSFENRQAKRLPSADDYNNNVEEIYNDINNCYKEIGNLKEVAKTYYNYSIISNQHYENKVKELKEITSNIENYVERPDVERTFIVKDGFKNTNKVRESNTSSAIDTIQGTVTLDRASSFNRNNKNTDIAIVGNSNGFPGTLHEVDVNNVHQNEYSENGDEKNIKFHAEDDAHLYLNAVQDNDADTWFEYEICNIPESKKQDPCKNYGFEYKDGTTWAKDPDNGKLVLTVEIKLPEASIINWIDVSPYIPQKSSSFTIKKIETAPTENDDLEDIYAKEYLNTKVGNDSQTGYYDNEDISGQNDFTGHGVFAFSPKKAKVIRIKMEQNSSYDTKIGHVYFERTTEYKITETSWFGLKKETSYKTKSNRVEGKKADLDKLMTESQRSIAGAVLGGWAGAEVGASIGSALGPLGAVVGGVLGSVLGSFWGSKDVEVVSSDVESGVEAFDGWRWAIGLRDINVNSYTYSNQSQITSEDFKVPGNIGKIELNAEEQIPELFYSEQSEQTSIDNLNEWVKYYVSVDEGSTWHRISPKDDVKSDIPNALYINANTPSELQNDSYKYINLDNKPNKVRFKAVLSRPTDLEDAKFYSPILKNYSLNVELEGGE